MTHYPKINSSLARLVRPTSALTLHANNARVHDERNIKAIADSLATFGQQKPIVIASDGVVIAGNGTLQAALRLGWSEIAVVELDVPSSDPLSRAYAIADNRTNDLSSFSRDALLSEIDALKDKIDIGSLGFVQDELQALRRAGSIELYEYETAKDRAREFVRRDLLDPRHAIADQVAPAGEDPKFEARVNLGDLWKLGQHRLICGDSLDHENLDALFDGQKASLCATDPPYLINYSGVRPGHIGKSEDSGKDWSDQYNEVSEDALQWYSRLFTQIIDRCPGNAAIYVWHSGNLTVEIVTAAQSCGILAHQFVVWVKPVANIGRTFFRQQHEPCMFGWKKGAGKPNVVGGLNESSVWSVDWEGLSRITTFHPTSKPVELFCRPMRHHTIDGDICFEPFAGSGSQIISGEMLKRRVFACELSPHFCDGILDRWERFVGNGAKAEKIGHFDQAGKAQPVSHSNDVAQGA